MTPANPAPSAFVHASDTGVARPEVAARRPDPAGGVAGEVPRHGLLARLDATEAGGVVVVEAGTGYGKSTLLRQWARTLAEPVVFISVAGVEDAATFQHRLTERCAQKGKVQSLPPADAPFVLVIDDVHCIRTSAALRMLHNVVARWRPPGRLVLAGRARPPAR